MSIALSLPGARDTCLIAQAALTAGIVDLPLYQATCLQPRGVTPTQACPRSCACIPPPLYLQSRPFRQVVWAVTLDTP